MWKDVKSVDEWVEHVVQSPIRRFYPTIVAKDLNLPLGEVYEQLKELAQRGKLKMVWEARCPECFSTLEIDDDKEELINKKYFECSNCGEEIEMIETEIFPAFKVMEGRRN